jgi:hypothetical protein
MPNAALRSAGTGDTAVYRQLVCVECGNQFLEDDAERGEDVLAGLSEEALALEDGELYFVEVFCPQCGSDDLEDVENLEAVREMKSLI